MDDKSRLRNFLITTLKNYNFFFFFGYLYNYGSLGDLRRTYVKKGIEFTISTFESKATTGNDLAFAPSRSKMEYLHYFANRKTRVWEYENYYSKIF
jgi:hypothetical protein